VLGALGSLLFRFERAGRIATAFLFAIVLVLIALRRVSLGGHPTYLGKYYAMLATDPFHPAPDNPVGHRILAPLLSYLVGLRGPLILYFDLFVVVVLLAAAYLWFRGRDHTPAWAVLGASTLALSMVVLTTLHYGGYPDALLYLLVFGAWWARSRLWLSGVLFLAAMLAHESAAFLAPWLFGVLAGGGSKAPRGVARAAGAIAATLIAFWGIHGLLERVHPEVQYTLGFYLRPLLADPLHWFRESAPHRGLGIAAAFNLYWVFPILAATRLALRGAKADALLLLLPIPCALAQLFVAYDVTRLTTLAFMSMLLGAEYLMRTNGFGARRWVLPLSLVNFFIPQVNVAMGVVDFMGHR
jgi:hypothetical protein